MLIDVIRQYHRFLKRKLGYYYCYAAAWRDAVDEFSRSLREHLDARRTARRALDNMVNSLETGDRIALYRSAAEASNAVLALLPLSAQDYVQALRDQIDSLLDKIEEGLERSASAKYSD
jgi:plasmid stabilization system protein ParE